MTAPVHPARISDSAGVILAAGRSSRMGAPKLLLPWPPPEARHAVKRTLPSGSARWTMLEAAVDVLRPWCQGIFIVVHHERERIAALPGVAGCTLVPGDPSPEMFGSIVAGLRAVQHWNESGNEPVSRILLHPGDHPEVGANIITRLLDESTGHPNQAILPEYRGKGGHPVVVSSLLVPGILSWHGQGGLRAYWEAHPNLVVRIPVDDESCTRDLDTPDVYWAATRD